MKPDDVDADSRIKMIVKYCKVSLIDATNLVIKSHNLNIQEFLDTTEIKFSQLEKEELKLRNC